MAHDQAGCCSESGPSALALALFITALPPPSRADVGQPDHDNASAAGLQLEAPLNEHESRCTTAARVMQPKVTATAEGAAAAAEEAAAAAMAAGSARPPLLLVLWASSQLSGGVRPGPVVDFRRGEAAL